MNVDCRTIMFLGVFLIVGLGNHGIYAKTFVEYGDPDKVQQSQYLPLNEGNKWVYRKTVPSGSTVYVIQPWPQGKESSFVMGPSQIKPGVFSETIRVKKKRVDSKGRESWEIEISPKTSRDGRYGAGVASGPDTLLWGRVVSSGAIIQIDETFIFAPTVFQDERQRKIPLLIEPFTPRVEASIINGIGEYTSKSQRSTVKVPAGLFKDCLEMNIAVKENSEVRTTGPGWITVSHYAPGVGLVKEIQKNSEGAMTYLLELVEYEFY